MFSPNAVHTLSQKSSASASSNSNGTSPIVTQSPDAVLPTTGVLSAAQQLPSGSTNERVSPLIFLSPNAGASASSHRSSSVSSGRTTPTEMLSTSAAAGKTEKVGNNKSGREKGAYTYSTEEHSALLKLLMCEPNSFNSSESSPEWRKVHKDMVENYYLQLGVVPRASSTLHSHFMELYSAFKQGVRSLSLVPGAPKCPSSVSEGDEEAVGFYVQTLSQLLVSDTKKFQPKKWWIVEVTSLLLCLHLTYMKSFGNGDQTLAWLEMKGVEAKGKFETDQKNREAEIARKRALEEEEMREAAKNRKLVAESSVQLSSTLGSALDLVAGLVRNNVANNTNNIDEKLGTMQRDIMQRVEDKLDEKFSSFLSVMQQMLQKKD
jgi:hypothetical protein